MEVKTDKKSKTIHFYLTYRCTVLSKPEGGRRMSFWKILLRGVLRGCEENLVVRSHIFASIVFLLKVFHNKLIKEPN
jgi:hypothetical protein